MMRVLFAGGAIAVAIFTALAETEACPFHRRTYSGPTTFVVGTTDVPIDSSDKPKKAFLPVKPGFVTIPAERSWWVFRDGSKELATFKKDGTLEKSYTRKNVAPYQVTLNAPDIATLEDYLTAKPGFVTKYDDGRLWVFRRGDKEYDFLMKHGDLEKHVIRIGKGPRGMTLRAPDVATIDAYLKAPD